MSESMNNELLIIEDDIALSEMLAMHFEDAGLRVTRAHTGQAGLERLSQSPVDVVLLDQQLPDGLGRDLIAPLLAADPDLPIVMMTGQHDLELAIAAIQGGAADFVHKPVKIDELQRTVERLLEQRRAAAAESRLPPTPASAEPVKDLIGRSDAMLAVSKAIALSARSSATVLIEGESGTGKEVVARMIHEHSGCAGPFVAINCAAIVDTLLESELFGHEKGAFTGAHARKLGKFEQAGDGTLFLDEIGELAAPLQAKLLRALQEQVFERVGGSEPIATNARIVAATNRDLLAEAAAGRFREDLAYRLKVIAIRMPPLRERREDIPLLVDGLLRRIAQRLDKPIPRITDAALATLCSHDWPGNVRELENLLTQALLKARQGLVTPDMLCLDGRAPSMAGASSTESAGAQAGAMSPAGALRSLAEVEAAHIQQVLDHTQGHKGHSAEILGISRPALDRKIKKYGLRVAGRG
jgi:two-component system response regulator AtoC